MQTLQNRKNNAPLTPNLQDYKQKNKSRSRRKQCAIQPTNPPTPKMPRPNINLKLAHEKHLDPKQPPAYSSQHNDKTAIRFAEVPQKKKQLNGLAYLSNEGNYQEQQAQIRKKKELDDFRKTIKTFGLKLQDAQSILRGWGYNNQEQFFQRKAFIQESFTTLREQLEQKKSELLGLLIEGHNKISETMNDRWRGLQDMRSAISRYLNDIENNYQDIIQDLSFDQFEDIMEKYHKKVIHFQKNIQHYLTQMGINIYIPVRQIQKLSSKCHVYLYPQFQDETININIHQNKTLNRYPTQKANLYVDNRHLTSKTNESLNKMSQHRQSRDREMFPIYHTGKQNYNFDNQNYR